MGSTVSSNPLRARILASLLVALVVPWGCGLTVEGLRTSAGGDASTDASVDATSADAMGSDAGDADPVQGSCPSGRGPVMLRVTGTSLCIDETEVSSRQYAPFVADFAAARVPAQGPDCTSNLDVEPLDENGSFRPPLDADDPVDRIDYCDAALYCAWAGKRLCGRVDGAAGGVLDGDLDDPAVSEWFAACSNNGRERRYRDANVNGNNVAGRNPDRQVVVSAPPTAGPSYPDGVLRHIVGNVKEWADGCDGAGNCSTRGGSAFNDLNEAECDSRELRRRSGRFADVGFRCCATVKR